MSTFTLTDSRRSYALLLMRIAVFCLLAGRAWQHLIWDAPFRTFLWSEELFGWVVQGLGYSWQAYATSPTTDAVVQGLIRGTGWCYALGAVLALVVPAQPRWRKLGSVYFWCTTAALTVLGLLYLKEKSYQLGQFFEYAAQVGSPAVLVYFLFRPFDRARMLFVLKVLIGLTFLCHGLYAFGYYPRPGGFVDMVINILGVSENTAHKFLVMAGVLDFVAVIFIFVPGTARVALAYCVVWGALTSAARLVAGLDFTFFASTLSQWWWESVMRVPHAVLPLVALYLQFGIRLEQVGTWRNHPNPQIENQEGSRELVAG